MKEFLSLIKGMLALNYKQRLTPEEALVHPFFKTVEEMDEQIE